MLVGSGMQDVIWPVVVKYNLHELAVGDAAHYGIALYLGMLGCHIEAHIVHGCLRLVYQHHLGRRVLGYLTYHLAAY